MGKYAEQRRHMLENGTLEEHLASVQTAAENYVDNYIDRYTRSEEYLKAEKKDPFEAMRLLNMTILEAEDAAYRIWIADIPEEDTEENEEEYDNE